MKENIILVGLMGAGKSTIGRQLAQNVKEFYDSDHVIEERTGVNIPMIFEFEGEEGFRDREECIIEDLCQQDNIILATGGGSVLRETNRNNLKKSGVVIYLQATAKQLYSRIRYDKSRPLMQTENPLKTLSDLKDAREQYYQDVADIIIPVGNQRVPTVVNKILRLVKEFQK